MKLHNPFLSFLLITGCLVSCGVSKTSFEQLQAEKDALQVEMIAIKSQMKSQNDLINELEEQNSSLLKEKQALAIKEASFDPVEEETPERSKDFEFSLRDRQSELNQLWSELDDAFKQNNKAEEPVNGKSLELNDFLYVDFDKNMEFKNPQSELIKKLNLDELSDFLINNPSKNLIVESFSNKENRENSIEHASQFIENLQTRGVSRSQLIQLDLGIDLAIEDKINFDDKAAFIVIPEVGKVYKIDKKNLQNRSQAR